MASWCLPSLKTKAEVSVKSKTNLIAMGILLGLVTAGAARAEGLYLGAKTGPMLVDVPGAKDPTNVGVTMGYDLGVVVADLAVEGELTTSLDRGSSANQAEVNTAAMYLAVRSPGPVYFKARGGVLRSDLQAGGVSRDETNASFGAGLGFSLGLAQFELEYTRVEDEVQFLSLGAQF
jgi:hypothetical protein